MTTSADITNRALAEIAARATVTGLVPNLTGVGSSAAAAAAANILYEGVVLTILRRQDWEFARTTATMTPFGAAPYPWAQAFTYPDDCVRVLQVTPLTWIVNDPQPSRWEIGVPSDGGFKTIYASFTTGSLTYTTSNVNENQWDSVFTEAVVRLLGSELAQTLGGHPQLSQAMLSASAQLVSSGAGLDS